MDLKHGQEESIRTTVRISIGCKTRFITTRRIHQVAIQQQGFTIPLPALIKAMWLKTTFSIVLVDIQFISTTLLI